MFKNLIVLPDGTQVSSGNGEAAIVSLRLTRTVNAGQELTLGSACASMLETTLFLPPEVSLCQGDALVLYRVDDEGMQHRVGVFIAQKPERRGTNLRKLTAYDRMVLFDREVDSHLSGLTQWPYTLQQLAQLVCQWCGVELATPEIPNGSFPVQAFTTRNCTGRHLLQWIGEVAGRFSRINPQGQLEFAWYTPGERKLEPTPTSQIEAQWAAETLTLRLPGETAYEAGVLQLQLDGQCDYRQQTLSLQGEESLFYYQGSLSVADYAVAPVEQVLLQQTAQDVGTVYPDSIDGKNVYRITGNPLLAALSAQNLMPVAATLYEQLRQVSYTPCKAIVPTDISLQPGQILQVADQTGKPVQIFLMSLVESGGRSELECTGSAFREGTEAVNRPSYQQLHGKVLNLHADVDGLRLENRDAQERITAVEADLNGLRTQVDTGQAEENRRFTELNQTAEEFSLFINRVETQGTELVKTRNGYTFSDQGLRIQRSGESVESLLTHEGLAVTRYGQMLLQADKDGVNAVDVTVGNYLILGNYARLEDYPGGRTACYHISEGVSYGS